MKAANKNSVGVVIRTKDRPIFVVRALACVRAQTHPHWHIMLVNDGGDAGALAEAIAPQADALAIEQRLTVLNLDPGEGRSAAFNRGVATLETEFVACLDDDDTWEPDFLSALMTFYDSTKPTVPDLAGVAAQVTALKEDFFDTETGREIRVIEEESLPPSFQRGEFFLNPLAYACYRQDIYPVQWVLRRDAVLAVGGFPEQFDVMEDRAFMNRFLARNRLAILDRKLAYHHRRASRTNDTGRNVLMNTLDNPSYDWRMFADLARPGVDLGAQSENAALIRSISADLLSELNYETSAIWQKVDGDIEKLSRWLDHEKADMQAAVAALMTEVMSLQQTALVPTAPAPQPLPEPVSDSAIFDLWRVFRSGDHGQHVAPGTKFAERLELSSPHGEDGLLMHASVAHRKLELQIPDTHDWTAVELCLDGLARPAQNLRICARLSSPIPYLFETALVQKHVSTGSFQFSGYNVHACGADTGCSFARTVDAAWLAHADHPKLSIILPRHAQNFIFICNSLRIEPS